MPMVNDKVTLSTLGTTVLGSTAWHTKDTSETTYQEIQVINQDNTVVKKLSIWPESGLVSLDVDVSGTEAVCASYNIIPC
ncbi:hypothetical protein [Paenibacillus amylolyticus]|uniref:hypothetical protein n=1 Tax=Paenibacillus amylolyticus TaxID=1451 RepID=UPI003D972F07